VVAGKEVSEIISAIGGSRASRLKPMSTSWNRLLGGVGLPCPAGEEDPGWV
jgi:hypothetical protein